MLTAGHCADNSGGGGGIGNTVKVAGDVTWSANKIIDNKHVHNSRSDVANFGVQAGQESHHIYKYATSNFKPINSRKTNGVYAQGASVCIASQVIGESLRCGEVMRNNVNATNQTTGITTRRTVRMNFDWPGMHTCTGANSAAGASGSPVFLNAKALGIWKGCVTGMETVTTGQGNAAVTTYVGLFSKLLYIEQDLNVTVKTS